MWWLLPPLESSFPFILLSSSASCCRFFISFFTAIFVVGRYLVILFPYISSYSAFNVAVATFLAVVVVVAIFVTDNPQQCHYVFNPNFVSFGGAFASIVFSYGMHSVRKQSDVISVFKQYDDDLFY